MKIILNVKITQHRVGYPYDRGRGPWQPVSTRYDIFRYCLASYAVLAPLVSKYHMYIELADEFKHLQSELEEYIKELFPEDALDLHWYRNNHTRDWRNVCNDHLSNDDEVIWFGGNDDHIFIDYNLDMVRAAIATLQQDTDELAVVYYSHWPEQIRMSHALGGELTADGNFIKYHWDNYDGIQMFKAARFKRYWFDADYGDDFVFRPDDLKNHYGYSIPSTFYAPIREMVRHYDGYVHVSSEVGNHAPPLFIPPGFFDNTMVIRIGFDDRDNTCTNCNPTATHLYNTDQTGVDYRYIEEDIPLFWKSHIQEIRKPTDYNTDMMLQARDNAVMKISRITLACFGFSFNEGNAPPFNWFKNHLRHPNVLDN